MNLKSLFRNTLLAFVAGFTLFAPYLATADDYVVSPGSHFSIGDPAGNPWEYTVTEVNEVRVEGFCQMPFINRFVAVDIRSQPVKDD